MKLKKFLIFALTAFLATMTLATVQSSEVQAKNLDFEYKHKTTSDYIIREMKAQKNYTSARISSDSKYEKRFYASNKRIYGSGYVVLKKNQTVTLQGVKVSVKDGYFVTPGQTKKVSKVMKNTNKVFFEDKLVSNSIVVKGGVTYLNGKKLTGSMNHKSVHNKDISLDFYNGRVLRVQETYF
ncbi:hypothetical protein ACIQ4I_13560 [Rummeliibacillus sp. NPDC094406]|uniref:hypothetical protein n=1 Tax=Rummeliibacillus sp. NPDC094406 TaxID=3364511 RepID=UPI0037FD8C65